MCGHHSICWWPEWNTKVSKGEVSLSLNWKVHIFLPLHNRALILGPWDSRTYAIGSSGFFFELDGILPPDGDCSHEIKRRLLGASVRHSTHGKGHEEGGSTYAKVGSSLRSPPGNSRASTPITRDCLLYYFVLSPTPLTLRGAVPHHLSLKKELTYSSS